MTKRPKKQKRVEPPTARPKTERVAVSSPTVPGAREEVEYVRNHIDLMRARCQLGRTRSENEFAYRAADKLRLAYETLCGSVGGTMDFDRVRGSGSAPMGPHAGYMLAAETMRDARTSLYPMDYRAITLCVIEGHTIEQAASILRRRSATRADREEVGRCMRHGLQHLAERWFGSGGGVAPAEHKIRAWSDPTNETTPATAGVVEVGGAYVSRRTG